MQMHVVLEGADKLQRALKRGTPKLHPKILVQPMRDWALDTQLVSKRDYLTGPRPERLGVVTGRLRGSIAVDLLQAPRYVDVGTNVVYGPVHEFGGKHHPARPFLRPAAEEAFRGFERDLAKAWEAEFK
jgi:hypothetical protein